MRAISAGVSPPKSENSSRTRAEVVAADEWIVPLDVERAYRAIKVGEALGPCPHSIVFALEEGDARLRVTIVIEANLWQLLRGYKRTVV